MFPTKSKKIVTINSIPPLDLQYEAKSMLPSSEASVAPSPKINEHVAFWKGDITTISAGAIVNAAKSSLLGGGGVDGAIHKAAGPGLLAECKTLDGCKEGEAKITQGYNLPAKNVIHTVGPQYSVRFPEKSEQVLRSCYENTLKVAAENRVRTVAFCGISTGIYGYPSKAAAMVACETIRKIMEEGTYEGKIDRILFVAFDEKDVDAYKEAIPKWFPMADQ